MPVDLSDFGIRLKTTRELKGLSQHELAELTNISRTSIQNYEKGLMRPKTGVLLQLAKALDCDGFWLLGGDEFQGKMSTALQEIREPFQAVARKIQTVSLEIKNRYQDCVPISDPDDYAYVPLVRAQASAGGGFALEDYNDEDIDYVAFRRSWLVMQGNPKNLKLMEVRGDSMEPVICDCDVVLLDFSRTDPRPGKIFAVAFDGHIYIKRLFAEPGRLILRSDNKIHADVVVDLGDDHQADKVTIIGQAICWFHAERP